MQLRAEHLPSMCETLGPFTSKGGKKKKDETFLPRGARVAAQGLLWNKGTSGVENLEPSHSR